MWCSSPGPRTLSSLTRRVRQLRSSFLVAERNCIEAHHSSSHPFANATRGVKRIRSLGPSLRVPTGRCMGNSLDHRPTSVPDHRTEVFVVANIRRVVRTRVGPRQKTGGSTPSLRRASWFCSTCLTSPEASRVWLVGAPERLCKARLQKKRNSDANSATNNKVFEVFRPGKIRAGWLFRLYPRAKHILLDQLMFAPPTAPKFDAR
jgi:hypothetical protein